MFGSLDLDEKLSMKQYVALRKDHRSLKNLGLGGVDTD